MREFLKTILPISLTVGLIIASCSAGMVESEPARGPAPQTISDAEGDESMPLEEAGAGDRWSREEQQVEQAIRTDAPAAASPAPTPDVGVESSASVRVSKGKTSIDFSEVTIDGEIARPSGAHIMSRKEAESKSLIKVRESFPQSGLSGAPLPSRTGPAPMPATGSGAGKSRGARAADKKRDHAISKLKKLMPLHRAPSASPAQRQKIAKMGQSGEELWVIARPKKRALIARKSDQGSGELRAKDPKTGKIVPLPLRHTDVRASIDGFIASVKVVQQYHNPFDSKIEATYVFPLPQDAAVSEFIMVIGDRRIRGIIRERQEAERIYKEARRQGYVASLLTQERPNIFIQKVANIEPGKRIDIELTYYNALPYRDGAYVFAFPMVVGPRFNPPGSTGGVGAVRRGQTGASGQPTEVSYLAPGERSGHDLSLTVDLDAGVSIEKLESSSHKIHVEKLSGNRRRVSLSKQAVIANKDFVLRYWVAGKTIKTALLRHEDDRGRYFTFMLQPPKDLKQIARSSREMIFVLDCSGSMNGVPLQKAKRAVRRVLELMDEDDTFQIIRFSNNASQLGARPLPATRANVRRGLRYLESLHGSGGTMMIEGIKAALDFPHERGKLRIVSFMTDGYIGNEAEILRAIADKLGPSRLFSFGVGSSVNRYLLERMALFGRGAVAYVELNDNATDEAVDAFYERIAYPALSDITIDWGNMKVSAVYPSRLQDLHVGRPVLITGRYEGTPTGKVRVTGLAGGKTVYYEVDTGPGQRTTRRAIAQVWARMRIADLANRATFEYDLGSLTEKIKETALSYGLVSAFTAFVAVDTSRRTEGDPGTTVPVPVPVPEGVNHDTSVSGG